MHNKKSQPFNGSDNLPDRKIEVGQKYTHTVMLQFNNKPREWEVISIAKNLFESFVILREISEQKLKVDYDWAIPLEDFENSKKFTLCTQ